MKLLIVISSYRVTDLTIDCLHSLSGEVTRVPGTKVVVCGKDSGVAAGGCGGPLRRISGARRADLTVVHPNLGFTGGNNIVIRPALRSVDPPESSLLFDGDRS